MEKILGSIMLKIAFFVIGDELLKGHVQDINTQYLANSLKKGGLFLSHVQLVKDDQELMGHYFKEALHHFDLIITSGGLGPTIDDRTEELIKKLSGELKKIPNQLGTAFGLELSNSQPRSLLLAAPGVPQEFQFMLDHEFIPRIFHFFSLTPSPRTELILRVANVKESDIFTKYCPELWKVLEEKGSISSLPHAFGSDITISLPPHSKTTVDDLLTLPEIKNLLPFIWGKTNLSPVEALCLEIKRYGLKLAVAESCSGGLLSASIVKIPGCSEYYQGSITSYSNEIKKQQLNVSQKTLVKYGTVSKEVAKEMAAGARHALNADIAISTTGVAGPGGGSLEIPVGRVCVGLSFPKKSYSSSFFIEGNRSFLMESFSQIAAFYCLKKLLEYFEEEPKKVP